MNRLRKQTLLAWFCLFSFFCLGPGVAEATVLCFDEHHVKLEAAHHIKCADCVPLQSAPLGIDDHCGDCVDIPIHTGVSEKPAVNAPQVSAQVDNSNFSILSFSESSADKTTTSIYSPRLSAEKDSILVSLGSTILLI